MEAEQAQKNSPAEAKRMRQAREIERHLAALDSFAPMALGVLAVASGIYTYLGVRAQLDGSGALTFFAAVAYSVAVSVAIFVFLELHAAPHPIDANSQIASWNAHDHGTWLPCHHRDVFMAECRGIGRIGGS
jgi:hypothetical protein